MLGLYVHIPFCKTICTYCDFPKIIANDCKKEEYINHLINELTLPPMSEEIFFMEDDVICTYFESASLKYYYGFLTGGTHIYTYHLDNK